MPLLEYQLVELRRAYEILDVAHTASAHAIKRAYRKLARRWHPDLYKPGTPQHTEATEMMKVLNEAYALVAHAPLRYYTESAQKPFSVSPPVSLNQSDSLAEIREFARSNARWEFWIRFVFGALLGVLVSLRIMPVLWGTPTLVFVVTGTVMIACGLGFARHGDNIWGGMFRKR